MTNAEKLRDLQEKREKLAVKIREMADKRPQSGDESGEWKQNWDAVNTDYDGVMDEIQTITNQIKVDESINARIDAIASHGAPRQAPFGRAQSDLNDPRTITKSWIKNQALAMHGWMLANSGHADAYRLVNDDHRNAANLLGCNLHSLTFNFKLFPTDDFLRAREAWAISSFGSKRNSFRSAYLNHVSEGDPTKGGFLTGETFLATLERAMLDFSGVLQVADIIRTSNGEPYRWPTVDDTSNTGSLVGEGADAGTATDPVFGRTTWYAETFTSGLIRVSRDLMQDSFLNMEQVLGSLLGERIGRKQNTVYTTGSGDGITPRGIVTDSVAGKTTASATAIAFDEIYDLENSIDPAYLGNAKWMMHRSIMNVVRKLKDGEGNYLWSRGSEAGMPDMLVGYPVFRNQDMASSVASGNKTMLFGDLSHYKVRQVNDISMQRLVERFAEYNQDAYIAYSRGDGKLLNAGTNPVKHMTH